MIDMIGRSLARFGCIAVIHQKLGSEYTRGARVSGFVVAVVVASSKVSGAKRSAEPDGQELANLIGRCGVQSKA